MLRVWITCFILSVASWTFGGEASIERDFSVDGSPENVSQWLQDNRTQIAESAGSSVVSSSGNTMRLRKMTLKGVYEFSIEETVTPDGDGYIYDARLVETFRGGLKGQVVQVTLSPNSAGGSNIHLYMQATVSDARDLEISTALVKSVRGFQRLLQSNF